MTEFEFKVSTIKELRTQLEILIKKSNDLINNIDNNGIDGNYSINSDILSVAQKIHSYSAILGYMKNFNLKLSFSDKKPDKTKAKVKDQPISKKK